MTAFDPKRTFERWPDAWRHGLPKTKRQPRIENYLELKEALIYANKKDEARRQLSRAGQLDLTPSEKAELMRGHNT